MSTSNLPSQASQRYSYIGIEKNSKVTGRDGPRLFAQLAAGDPRFAEYGRLLRSWPGLVSGPPEALIEDSLVLLAHLAEELRIIDVGSGGGMPGLPLKLVRPELQVTLLEADKRKAAFLVHASAQLGLDFEVVAERAETAARGPLRESFDVVTARALAPPGVMLELCLPFARIGGRLLAMRTAEETAVVGDLGPVAATLGGGPPIVHRASSPGREQGTIVAVPKLAPTPAAYPRRPGVPNRRPLGG